MSHFYGFETGNLYHVYNHGVDERSLLQSKEDSTHFLMLLELLNTKEVLGNISEIVKAMDKKIYIELKHGRHRLNRKSNCRLVDIIAYCLNPNHFHIILEQVNDNGVSMFLHKLTMSYSKYFNAKYARKGALFSGTFKKRHIASDEYLMHASAYVNLNDRVHSLQPPLSLLVRSSWNEYTLEQDGICVKDIVLSQFKNKREYREYALQALEIMRQKKIEEEDLLQIGIDL